MELHLVNTDSEYGKARLVEPAPLGYIYLAGAVRQRRAPFVFPSRRRARLLSRLKRLARELEDDEHVLKATVFRAIVIPPTARFSHYLKQHHDGLHVADYDVMVLVQTTSPESARRVRASAAFARLEDAIRAETPVVRVMAAHNVRRIADVDTRRKGLFLFNHFAADDPEVMLQLWDYLADWYAKETGLDNSVALAPEPGEPADYAIVNWARWDTSPGRHFWRQLTRQSFWRYVTANLEENHAASMPVYCRLA